MSEYQYYEFAAVDQPLTRAEQAELRAISTRARITPTGFVNTYEWGDLKADPRRLVERYFDAFLYLANWGTRRLMFRLPARAFGVTASDLAGRYCVGDSASAWPSGEHLIVDLIAEDEPGDDEWLDGSGLLASIVPARADLAAGDLRLLYLAWLLAVQNGEVDDDAVEPAVPAELGRLSASLSAVADFLRIDSDLLAVAAERSTAARTPDPTALSHWLAQLPARDKDSLLLRVAQGEGPRVRSEILSACRPAASTSGAGDVGRTAGEMLARAEARREARRRAAWEEAERREAERRRVAERVREERLTGLAGRQEQAWRDVGELIERRKPAEYDTAVALLRDLAEVCRREGTVGMFAERVEQLRLEHRRKVAFIERLDRAGPI